jgi:hypothetical protein
LRGTGLDGRCRPPPGRIGVCRSGRAAAWRHAPVRRTVRQERQGDRIRVDRFMDCRCGTLPSEVKYTAAQYTALRAGISSGKRAQPPSVGRSLASEAFQRPEMAANSHAGRRNTVTSHLSPSSRPMLPAPRSAQVTLASSQDGQSLARWTLPGSLAVSTELANRAVSSICLAGLCDWSLACVSFGFDPLSSSSTVGFRGILVSPWPFTVPTSIQRIGCGTCTRFWDKDYDYGKLLDGLESMRRFISTICFGDSQRSRIGYQAHCGTNLCTRRLNS